MTLLLIAPHINYVTLKENDFSMMANCSYTSEILKKKKKRKAVDESAMAGDFNALSTLTLSNSSGRSAWQTCRQEGMQRVKQDINRLKCMAISSPLSPHQG